MGRLNLFDDGGDFPDDLSKIEINHEYARRYEHNKKREDLHRLEDLKNRGRVDSDSEDESSEEEDLAKPSKKADSKFFDALIRVKKQDPTILDKDAKLFDSEDDDDSEDSGEEIGEKKKKPIHLRNWNAEQLLKHGADFNGEEDDGENVKTYTEEQEEHRRAFLKAVEEGENDEEGDFLTVKNDGNKVEEEDDELNEKLDNYFDKDEKLDEDSKFLKDYFRGRMWIDEKKCNNIDDEIEVSEDEEEIERQEEYERDFNFRYEENAGDRILGHSRKIEGSVRKIENARKSQRERKEERIKQAEFERKEELKRLKNLKKKEINERLEKIREVAGIGKDEGGFLDDDDLEGDFDPEAYDRKMKSAFGDGYYDAKDVDPGFGTDDDENEEKPDFDKEDELLGLKKGWDEANGLSGDGFLSNRERIMKEKVEVIDEAKEGKRKRKRKPSEVEAVKNELLEEYYKLDYEGTIGDLKTRFKYKPVVKRKFGLKCEDVLMLDDKELNEYVSLKKIAPYVEQEWKVPRTKTVQLKQRLWGEDRKEKGKAVEEELLDRKEKGKAVDKDELLPELEPEPEPEPEPEGEMGKKSRKAQRRSRQAELKLSQQRLMAYGKIPPQAKSKKK